MLQKAVAIKYMRRYIKINYYKDFIQLTVSQAAEYLNFGKKIEFDEDTETLKCFIWDGSMKPVGEIYKGGVSEPTENPSATKTPSATKRQL